MSSCLWQLSDENIKLILNFPFHILTYYYYYYCYCTAIADCCKLRELWLIVVGNSGGSVEWCLHAIEICSFLSLAPNFESVFALFSDNFSHAPCHPNVWNHCHSCVSSAAPTRHVNFRYIRPVDDSLGTVQFGVVWRSSLFTFCFFVIFIAGKTFWIRMLLFCIAHKMKCHTNVTDFAAVDMST